MSTLKTPSRLIMWMMWIVVSVFYAYQYLLRVMPNIMLNEIMTQFKIDAVTFGQFSGIYYIGYSLMHLPLGILLDRYGPKKMMSLCILLTVVGLTPLLFADHWIYPIIGRFLIGLGSSAAILGVFKIVRMVFKQERFSRMLSLSVTIGLIGAIYGGGPVNYMTQALGHQMVVKFFALIGLILAGITYWIIPDIKTARERTVLSDIKEVLGNRRVIMTCLFAGLMVGPLEGFADVWGTAFLKNVYYFEGSLAASLPSMVFIGMCFGAPVLNFCGEKFGNYLLTIMGAALTMALCFFLMVKFSLSARSLTLSFILIGTCSAYQILAIYKASTYASDRLAGLTTAVANMIIMVFGYGFHTVIGGVVKACGGATVSQALIYGVSVIPIALMLGAIGFFYLLLTEKNRKKVSVKVDSLL